MKRQIVSRVGMAILLGAALLALLPLAPAETVPQPKSIGDAVKPYTDSKSVAGAVMLVADRNKVLAQEALGYADLGASRPMLVDAIFWIASMSKPITAAALMILVDEGKVSLDDPVEKYLPEFKDIRVAEKGKEPRKPAHPITVREVLSHTSGLTFRSPQEEPTIDVLPLKDAVNSYTKTTLLYEPGTSYKYSNAGINVAGRIIEVVSGMSYEEFLDKRLFGPLGMKDTTFWLSEAQVKRLAKSYKANKAKDGLEETTVTALKYPLTDRKTRFPCPGGGLFSTASDCGVFCQMLLGGGTHKGKRILSEASVKEMAKRQTPSTVKESYGLGFSVSGDGFGHGGAYATNMSIDTKRGMVTVWMVQQSGGYPGKGGEAIGAFRKAAIELYGNSK
jgi:CubicO group peptidase (beta-lactamase class C family)